MATLTIAEVARRSGFTASALRYYEGIGLVPAAERTDAGYRTYDEAAVARLAFVARAKQLGCTLAEITELVAAWERDRCEPVQARLRELVAGKVRDAQHRIAELTAFAAQLQGASHALAHHTPDGACDDRCGCTTVEGWQPTAEPAIACTLAPDALGQRLDDWQALLASVVAREPVAGGVRLRFAAGTSAAQVAALAQAEQGCCAFFTFAVGVGGDGVTLEVVAPDDALPVVESLFGAAAGADHAVGARGGI